MKAFFDTSVLIAAFRADHIHHDASLRAFAAATKKDSACSMHTLAEIYSVLSALPVKPPISPEHAMLFVDEAWSRLLPIALAPDEYHAAIQEAASRGFSGGRVYDALLLQCARKCKARMIYTWNLKHFRVIAPDLAGRIQTPEG